MFQIHVVEKKTFSITFFPPPFENRTVYEIMWKNIVERGRPQITWRVRVACCIPKAADRHSEYVIKTKLNSVALVRERTIPTERPPPVGEVSANFCG